MSKKHSENLKLFFFKKAIYNIIAFIIAVVILIVLGLTFLRSYTHHGEYINVPSLKGMDLELAKKLIANSDLHYELIDSLYVKGAVPGSIVEIIPEENSKVKRKRVLYLKTQKLAKQMVTIPELKDYSEDAAVSKLRSLGISRNRISIEYAPSKYQTVDIVLYNKKNVDFPKKVPLDDVHITLVVGDGNLKSDLDEHIEDDSINMGNVYFE